MPIDYYRDPLLELDRAEGIGLGSLITLAVGGVLLLVGLITHTPWTIFIGGLTLFLGTLGALQGLFDVVVFLADPESGAFVIRRFVWRKLDEESSFPLDDIERFELEFRRSDDDPDADDQGKRIVARLKSGESVPLIKEFSAGNLQPRVDLLNAQLRTFRCTPPPTPR